MYFWLILIVLLAVLFGSAVRSAARWLARLFLSVALAIMIAVPAGVLLMDRDEDEVALALLLAVILAAGLFWLLRPRAAAPVISAAPTPKATPRRRPLKCGTFRMVLAADQIAQVWDQLEEEASHQAARVAIARRSSERARQALRPRHFDVAAHSTLIMLEKRIPELIDKELSAAADLPAPARMNAIDDLVELLERFAADCERQLASDRRMGPSETQVLRQHIENYLRRDGMEPFRF